MSYRVEPLVDIGDVAALLARHLLRALILALLLTLVLTLFLALIVRSAKIRRGRLAERGVQPIVE
ncbi:hypothetical protein ACVW0J_000555 [Bradyrhizobium sp. i1.7.7]